jgi:chitin disaccharide deacetylase
MGMATSTSTSIRQSHIAHWRAYGLRAVRVPRKPAAVLAENGLSQARADQQTSDFWRGCCRCAFDVPDCAPDQVFGLAWPGAMSTPRLDGLLPHLRSGSTEIYLHPATRNDFAGSRPSYRYADELAALIDPGIRALTRRPDAALAGYCDA